MCSGACALLTCPEVEILWTCQPSGHQLQEGAEEGDDPEAEKVDDLGTQNVGQCGVYNPMVEDQKTIQGLMTQ